MKKKIGELYDKPIVIGNKNKVKKHEIHIDELSVPQEGGGGSNYEYLDLSGLDENTRGRLIMHSSCLFKLDEVTLTEEGIFPTGAIADLGYTGVSIDAKAMAMIPSLKIVIEGQTMTIQTFIEELIGADQLAAIPRLTEEEFYSLT